MSTPENAGHHKAWKLSTRNVSAVCQWFRCGETQPSDLPVYKLCGVEITQCFHTVLRNHSPITEEEIDKGLSYYIPNFWKHCVSKWTQALWRVIKECHQSPLVQPIVFYCVYGRSRNENLRLLQALLSSSPRGFAARLCVLWLFPSLAKNGELASRLPFTLQQNKTIS